MNIKIKGFQGQFIKVVPWVIPVPTVRLRELGKTEEKEVTLIIKNNDNSNNNKLCSIGSEQKKMNSLNQH